MANTPLICHSNDLLHVDQRVFNWTKKQHESSIYLLRFPETVNCKFNAIYSLEQIEKNKDEFFMAWNTCLHHVITLAMAHIHKGERKGKFIYIYIVHLLPLFA